jgi:hypothetical protein
MLERPRPGRNLSQQRASRKQNKCVARDLFECGLAEKQKKDTREPFERGLSEKQKAAREKRGDGPDRNTGSPARRWISSVGTLCLDKPRIFPHPAPRGKD